MPGAPSMTRLIILASAVWNASIVSCFAASSFESSGTGSGFSLASSLS